MIVYPLKDQTCASHLPGQPNLPQLLGANAEWLTAGGNVGWRVSVCPPLNQAAHLTSSSRKVQISVLLEAGPYRVIKHFGPDDPEEITERTNKESGPDIKEIPFAISLRRETARCAVGLIGFLSTWTGQRSDARSLQGQERVCNLKYRESGSRKKSQSASLEVLDLSLSRVNATQSLGLLFSVSHQEAPFQFGPSRRVCASSERRQALEEAPRRVEFTQGCTERRRFPLRACKQRPPRPVRLSGPPAPLRVARSPVVSLVATLR